MTDFAKSLLVCQILALSALTNVAWSIDNPSRLKSVAQLIPGNVGGERVIKEVLSQGAWDDDILKDVAKLSTVERIKLSDKSAISAKGWSELRRLRKMQVLEIYHADLADESVDGIASLRSLKRLIVIDNKLTGESLHSLANLSNIEDLYIEGTNIKGGSFGFIGKLSKLKYLNLSTTQFDDADAVHIGKLSRLTQLQLIETQITDKAIEPIFQAPSLQYVFISSPFLSDRAIRRVKKQFEIGSAYRIGEEP